MRLGWLGLVLIIVPGIAGAQASSSPYTTGYRYDAARRLVGTIGPDPDDSGPLHYHAIRNTYDLAGRLITIEEGELASWQSDAILPSAWTGYTVFKRTDISYDVTDNKLKETVSSGVSPFTTYIVTQYSYDSSARLQCTAARMNPAAYSTLPASACVLGTEGAGESDYGPDRITRNVYDTDNRIVQIRKAVGTSIEQAYVTYSFTANGKQQDVVDTDGNHAKFTYDGFDRLAAWNFSSPTAPTAFNGSTPASAFSTAGAVSTTDFEAYGYDANANRTSLKRRDGRTLTYAFDALNRMTSKIVPDGCAPIQTGACTPAGATRDVYYAYDLRGLQTAARYDSTIGSDAVTESYDGFGELASSTTSMGGISRTLTFQFDTNGNRTRVTHPDGNYFVYSYDGLDRPSSIAENGTTMIASMVYNSQGELATLNRGGVVTNYIYDPILRTASIADDLVGTGADLMTSFSYNPANEQTIRTRNNDAYAWTGAINVNRVYAHNGLNQYASAGPASFLYDANGNLITDGTTTYVYDAENRLVTAGAVTLTYDPLGRLYQTAGGSPGTTQYLYDGDKLSAEYNGAGTLLRRYIHDRAEDTPLIWYEGAVLSDRRSLQDDEQGSIVSVANAAGTALGINGYDDYGIPNVAANLGRFQYTGQAWLPELGMYYYKARIYSPTLGRFLQTDPVGYNDQVNLYGYVGNDPINRSDPTGELQDESNQTGQLQADAIGRLPDTGRDVIFDSGMEIIKAQTCLGCLGGLDGKSPPYHGTSTPLDQIIPAKTAVGVPAVADVPLIDAANNAFQNNGMNSLVGRTLLGWLRGIRIHSMFAASVKELGPMYHAEVSYRGGRVVPYGTVGSVRADAVYGPINHPFFAVELKSGAAYVTKAEVDAYSRNLPTGTGLYEIKEQ
ncbi:MAG TPA: RHS repeat-associated core domain-containing protein [Allosphingosinicella sp.]|jgi:RHS repeat-associated protein